jgi:rare lipoprotein A
MQTTKLILIMMIGLAIIEFSIVQSSTAAAPAPEPKSSLAAAPSAEPSADATVVPASTKSMKGLAAVYSDKFNGRKTASGQKFCQNQLTAAHRSLPLGTKVRVTNVQNSKSIEVRINDRGPFHTRRVIDLSTAAAAKVGMGRKGIALVKLEVVNEPSSKKS